MDELLLSKEEVIKLIGSGMKSKLKGVVRETRAMLKGTPSIAVMEAVVNSIQAAKKPSESRVNVKIIYETVQENLNFNIISTASKDRKAYVKSFEITDNGQGFNEDNLSAFNELYTECKKDMGCKGIGRVTWLAIFDHVEIESHCTHNGERSLVKFHFDEDNEITNNSIEPSDVTEDKTIVRLVGVREGYKEKIRTNAEKLSEEILDHCLSYYISGNYPDVTVEDIEGSVSVTQVFNDRGYDVKEDNMEIFGTKFSINHLLSKSSKTKSHSTSFYCANGRVVQEEPILKDITIADAQEQYYSYILYLSGKYLDDSVNTDRLAFTIPSREELHDPNLPTVEDISEAVEEKAREFLGPMIEEYENGCKQRADTYIREHPEFKYVLSNCPDILKKVTPNADNESMYSMFNQAFADLESKYVFDFEKASKGSFNWKDDDERIVFFKKISETQQAVLAKYMSHRKYVIDLFEKQLRIYQDANDQDKYAEEDKIHDILMPQKMTSGDLTIDNCNMWMVDERLNYYSFTSIACSDLPFKSFSNIKELKRPDICIFSDKRGDQILAVTLIELKRPNRTDKDVLDQVKDYIRKMKQGELKDYHGRPVKISDGAVFYCYVLCDIDEKRYGEYLQGEEFSRIYSGRSYYRWYSNYSAHIEFIDFDHLLNDTKVRNSIFFNLLNGNNPNNLEPGKY